MANATAPVVDSSTTSHSAANTGYSATNLPTELFRLEPPLDYGVAVFAELRGSDGRVRRKSNGQPYEKYPWLPNRISIQPEPFMLEYWNKKHPDCSYADFEIRMQPGPGERLPVRNTLNMRRARDVRLPLNIPCWVQKVSSVTMIDCLIFESLSLNSVRRNTVLPVRPWGLLKPSLPGAERQLASIQTLPGPAAPPAPPVPLPLRTFTDGKDVHIPSAKLNAVKDMTASLQDKAFERLLPHWIFLQDREKPRWWKERRGNNAEDNVTIPLPQAIPHPAREWIKECVRDAAEPQNRLTVPPLSILPKWTRGWVSACMVEGRARSPIGRDLTIGGWNEAINSANVIRLEDNYRSDLSVSLNFTDEKAPSEKENIAGSSDVSGSPNSSEEESDPVSEPEIGERTEGTWAEHSREKHRVRAVAEALETGQPDEAVVLAENSAEVELRDRSLLVLKNVLVLPKDEGEDGQERVLKKRRTET